MAHQPEYTITTYLHDREAELKAYDEQYRARIKAMTPDQRVTEHAQLLKDIDNIKYRPLGMSAEAEERTINRKIAILKGVQS